jgi:hypothetical protein
LICNEFYSLHEFFNQCDWLTSLFFLGSVILDSVCVCVYIDYVFVFFLVLCIFLSLCIFIMVEILLWNFYSILSCGVFVIYRQVQLHLKQYVLCFLYINVSKCGILCC